MRMRTFLVSTHLVNFLIGIFATCYVLNSSWSYLETWQISFYVYIIVLGFCGLVIASWIVLDGRYIGQCADVIEDMERRLLDLERQIDRIKTERLNNVQMETKH